MDRVDNRARSWLAFVIRRVHSLSYRAAKQRLQDAHLGVGTVQRRYSSRTPKNHVLGQYPHGGGYAHRTTRQGPRVTLTLSRGPHT